MALWRSCTRTIEILLFLNLRHLLIILFFLMFALPIVSCFGINQIVLFAVLQYMQLATRSTTLSRMPSFYWLVIERRVPLIVWILFSGLPKTEFKP